MTRSSSRQAFLRGCALVALLAPVSTRAQSFQATPNVVMGTATITTGATSTSIAIKTPQTIIDWTPTDVNGAGTINFQPLSTLATFFDQGAPGGRYTVLNRILPVDAVGNPSARAVQFNGTVNSTSNAVQGGTVWFYSPTGIILSSSASFSVGSLLLTTNDPDTANGIDALGSTLFNGKSGGFVQIQTGAQINAASVGASSYVAAFSPRVEQRGTISVDGSALFAAGEAGQIDFNAGLVDVTIFTGTDDANGIVHTGTTGGPASTGLADVQRIKMIAITKNTAMTMLLSGTIGYTPAAVAAQDGTSVLLQAGDPSTVGAAGTPLASMTVGDATIRNRATLAAENLLLVNPKSQTRFNAVADLVSARTISLLADTAGSIVADAALNLTAGVRGAGGSISLLAGPKNGALPAGQIKVAGALTARTQGVGTIFGDPPAGLPVAGGVIAFSANGGTIDLGSLDADASATGADGEQTGGDATGGTVSLTSGYGGLITTTSTKINVNAQGGNGAATGGKAKAGTIQIADIGKDPVQGADATGGTLTLGAVQLSAGAAGGTGAAGGDASGGTVGITLARQTHSWTSLTSAQNAIDGAGAFDPIGGNFTLNVAGPAVLNLIGNLIVNVDATAGVDGPAGSFAQGGTVTIGARGGGVLDVRGRIQASANGSAFAIDPAVIPGVSPDARGGTISVLANGGTIRATELTLNTDAIGIGATTTAGQVRGGNVSAGALNGGLLRIRPIAAVEGVGNVLVSAQAFGGHGPQAANATGGTARLFASDGTVSVGGTTTVTADARGGIYAGLAGPGFSATGGNATLDLARGQNGTGAMVLDGAVAVTANALADMLGGAPIVGNGGKGAGGTATVSVAAGTFQSGAVTIEATGTGGRSASSAGAPFVSGNGQGGTANYLQSGGTATPGAVTIAARGVGGAGGAVAAGGVAAIAGNGTGGNAAFNTPAGTFTGTTITLDAGAAGGVGAVNPGGPGGRGGNATGGTATLLMPLASTASVTATGTVTIGADATGGSGGAGSTAGLGGDATGGTAAILLSDGRFAIGATAASAAGLGGAGGTLGRGTGGTASFTLVDTLGLAAAPRTLASLTLVARGADGSGADDAGGTTGLTLTTGAPGATLTIAGDLAVRANGATGAAGNGFTGVITGPVPTIGGQFSLITPRDAVLTIAPGNTFTVGGGLDFTVGRTFTGTGLVATPANARIVAQIGLSMTDLNVGGTTLLRSAGGPVRVNELRSTGLVTVLGGSVDLASTGALSFADADAVAGNLSVKTVGNLDLTTVDTTGAILLTSTGGAIHNTGAVGGNGITYVALGNIQSDAAIASGGGFSVTAGGMFATPSASAAGNVSIDATGGINAAGVASGGTALLRATGGNVAVNALTSTGPVTLLARTANVASPAALTFASAQTTTGNLSLSAATGLAATQLNSAGTTLLQSTAGAVTVASLTSAGAVTATGRSVDLTAPGTMTLANGTATAGALSVRSAGNLDVTAASATGALTLTSTGAAVHTTGAVSGDSVTLTANGAVATDAAVTATNALAINAGGTYTAGGATVGRTIAVGSSDIVLTPAARVGTRGTTQTIVLTNALPTTRTFIGGASQANVWSLSAAEALQLFADQRITISLPGTAAAATAGDFVIGQLALSYGANAQLGTGGEFKLLTPGRVAVIGAVRLTTSSAADRFSIDSSRIDVLADTGSIVMRDGAGALGGALNLVGGTVFVGSQAALTDIAALATDAITARLGIADLPAIDGGWLQAGQLNLSAVGGLFIQNSGAGTGFVNRRGFSANGVAITTANVQTKVVINGVNVIAGVPRLGLDTAATVTINGVPAVTAGLFDRFSSINGCIIGLDCRGGGNVAPGDSVIDGSLTGLANGSLSLLLPLLEYRALEPFDSPPLIDEPVTGVGNDDLWQERCEEAKDGSGSGCPAKNGD